MKDAIFYIKVPVDTKYITTDGKGKIVAWTEDMPVYHKGNFRWYGGKAEPIGTRIMQFNRLGWYQPKIAYVAHMVSFAGALKISVKVPDCAKYITCSKYGLVEAWLSKPEFSEDSGVWVLLSKVKPVELYTIREISVEIAKGQIIELKE